MNHLHDTTPFVLAVLAASIVALALGLLAERLARRASAAARHTILVASLLVPLVLVLAGTLGLNLPLPVSPPGGAVDVTMAAAQTQAEPGAHREWPCILAGIWLAGAAIALLRVAAITSRWRDVARRAVPVFDDELLRQFGARYELAQSPDCPEPTVIGILSPTVVLPAGYNLSHDEMQAVFAHELAHVSRRDNLIALAVQAICALFWFDPLHLVARRKLVELRERACDDAVLDAGCDPRAYIAALARSCQTSFHVPAVACMSRLNLQERMESIMTHETRRRLPAWIVRTLATAVVAAAAIAFATFAPSPSLHAGEPGAAAGYDFSVDVHPQDEGRFTLVVKMLSPDGNFTSAAVVPSAPDVRTISTSHGGKTYAVTVRLAADGTATGSFEVTQGTLVLSASQKTFVKPMPRLASNTMPAPPAPPNVKRMNDPGVTPAKPISRVEPRYPAEAKASGIGGICIVEAIIDEQGDVSEVRVVKPLGHGLDEATVDAVRQWKFAPAMLDGKPVAVAFNVTMNFRTE